MQRSEPGGTVTVVDDPGVEVVDVDDGAVELVDDELDVGVIVVEVVDDVEELVEDDVDEEVEELVDDDVELDVEEDEDEELEVEEPCSENVRWCDEKEIPPAATAFRRQGSSRQSTVIGPLPVFWVKVRGTLTATGPKPPLLLVLKLPMGSVQSWASAVLQT